MGRNTAPAILYGTLKILKESETDDALVFVFPADHVIDDETAFEDAIGKADMLAHDDYIVTFGIKPKYPETGYGYIEGGEPVDHGGMFFEVGGAIDHSKCLDNTLDSIERTKSVFQGSQNGQAGNTSRFVAEFLVDICAYPSGHQSTIG